MPDYADENVSTKVVKIVQSYTGIVDRMVWRKYQERPIHRPCFARHCNLQCRAFSLAPHASAQAAWGAMYQLSLHAR